MKKIQLTKGQVALVDDEQYERLNNQKWHMSHTQNNPVFYAKCTNTKMGRTYMHRVIMNAPKDMQVDHIDGNGLNNQKNNLRLVTRSQNQQNKKKYTNNTSGYKGVYLDKRSNKWFVRIGVNGKYVSCGEYFSKELAHQAYEKAALKYHGEYANA